jgi:hypothetical protein
MKQAFMIELFSGSFRAHLLIQPDFGPGFSFYFTFLSGLSCLSDALVSRTK